VQIGYIVFRQLNVFCNEMKMYNSLNLYYMQLVELFNTLK